MTGMTLVQAREHEGALAAYRAAPGCSPELVQVDVVSGPVVLGVFAGSAEPFAMWPEQLEPLVCPCH